MQPLVISNCVQIDEHLEILKTATGNAHRWIAEQTSNPMGFLRSVKFERHGYHPISGERINLIEQINQTFTFAAALEATRILLRRHPDAEGFSLAPGETMSQELDIMSCKPNLVGAETFAATSPDSNRKLLRDVTKLLQYPQAQHRYVFFAAPNYKHGEPYRKGKYWMDWRDRGVEVWTVEV